MKKHLFIFGTRPEAIKFAPLIKEFDKYKNIFTLKICVTEQHKEMLKQVLDFFNIIPDYKLNIMKKNQTLFDVTSNVLNEVNKVILDFMPDVIWVQGDTTTAFAASLAGYYNKIKIAHLEAGLRSYNKYSPFPEEINRKIISCISDFHFAPTEAAVKALNNEGINKNIWNVGNSVIDALFMGIDLVKKEEKRYIKYFDKIDFHKKIILVTGHRRESFGKSFENICFALKEIANIFRNEVEIIYPVHLNPNVQRPVLEILGNLDNVHLLEPLSYPFFIWLMNKSYIVITDSGGVQEEAPSLGKPVLIIRNVTERAEGVKAGTAKLIGTNKDNIIKEVVNILNNNNEYKKMANSINPYGDGTTSKQIVNIILKMKG